METTVSRQLPCCLTCVTVARKSARINGDVRSSSAAHEERFGTTPDYCRTTHQAHPASYRTLHRPPDRIARLGSALSPEPRQTYRHRSYTQGGPGLAGKARLCRPVP